MSLKLADLVIKPHNGKLVIGKPNKRGHLKNFLDISTPLIKTVIELLTTTRDKTYIHQEIVDPETNEIKHYKITCYEMTEDEVLAMKQNRKRESIRAQRNIASLMGLMLNGLGRNNLRF